MFYPTLGAMSHVKFRRSLLPVAILGSFLAVALVAAVGCPDAHAGEVPVAYVQFNPGASGDEQELLAFAAEHIAERAAVPKRIEILEALPLTPVGKIFKPALQQREIAQVVRLEAERNGLAGIAVEVVQDARRGLVVQLTAAPDQERLAAALGRYSFQVEWLPPSPAIAASNAGSQ